MGPCFVVTLQPLGTDFPDLIQGFKPRGIQHVRSIRASEAFEKAILGRFARLDVSQFDSVFGTPAQEVLGDTFRPIV